jgi:hypothetical protein
MPIGPYENFAECVADQKSKGHSEESSNKICGMLEHRAKGQEWVNSLFEKKILPDEKSGK